MYKKTGIIMLICLLLALSGCNMDQSKLTASSVAVAVPDVVGMNLNDAESRCANAGFDTETVFVASSEPADTVIQTDPAGNTKIQLPATVKLFCSRGASSTVRVPDIIGKSMDEAKDILNSLGLQVGDIKYKATEKPKDTVVLTNPLPGLSVRVGSVINLTLSTGSKKERSLDFVVELPEKDGEIDFKVYVDGQPDSSLSRKIDLTTTDCLTLNFKGKTGTRIVTVYIDNDFYKSYILDFDEGSVTEESSV